MPISIRISTKISKIPGIRDWDEIPEGSKKAIQQVFIRQIWAGLWPLRTFPAHRFWLASKSEILLDFGSSYSLYFVFGVFFGGVDNNWLCLRWCVNSRIPAFFETLTVGEWKNALGRKGDKLVKYFSFRPATFWKVFVDHFFKKKIKKSK